MTAIYKIQSLRNPKRCYIGSAINIVLRWREHLNKLQHNKHHSIKLQNHFNKYGEIDLQFSILLGCDKEDLIKIEQYFIDSYKPWFNIRQKADSNLGIKWSKESRDKLSKAQIGKHCKPCSEETKKKISDSKKGKKASIETRNKMKKTRSFTTDEVRQKISNAGKGRRHSDETKDKMRLSALGKKRGRYKSRKYNNILRVMSN